MLVSTLLLLLVSSLSEQLVQGENRDYVRHIYLEGSHLLELAPDVYSMFNARSAGGDFTYLEYSKTQYRIFKHTNESYQPMVELGKMSQIERSNFENAVARMFLVDSNSAFLPADADYFSVRYYLGGRKPEIIRCSPRVKLLQGRPSAAVSDWLLWLDEVQVLGQYSVGGGFQSSFRAMNTDRLELKNAYVEEIMNSLKLNHNILAEEVLKRGRPVLELSRRVLMNTSRLIRSALN